MTGRNPLILVLLAVILGLLPSCIDIHEEYWLSADGGARAELIYQFPKAAAAPYGGESGIRELIDSFLKDTPEITTTTRSVSTQDDRIRVHIVATVRSAAALEKFTQPATIGKLPPSATHLVGDIRAGLHGRTLHFTRTITPSKAFPGASLIPASRLKGHRVLHIVHLPAAASESNATRTAHSGHTLVWDTPLATALKSPVVSRFQMPLPIPWGIVSAIAAPLAAVCGFIVFRFRRLGKPNHLSR